MGNKKLVYLGITIFLVIVALPFWYNHGKAVPAPGGVEVRVVDVFLTVILRPDSDP